jgi:hypothetical protein
MSARRFVLVQDEQTGTMHAYRGDGTLPLTFLCGARTPARDAARTTLTIETAVPNTHERRRQVACSGCRGVLNVEA